MQIGFMLLRSLYKFLHEKWGFQSKGTRWLSRKWNSGSQHVWKVTGCHFHCPLGGVCSCSYWLLCVSWIRKAARCNLPSLTTVTFCALAVKHCFANCSPFCLFIFMVFSFWKVWSLKYIYIYFTLKNYNGRRNLYITKMIVNYMTRNKRRIKLCSCVIFLRSVLTLFC